MIGVGPGQDLRDGQIRQSPGIPNAAPLSQKHSQGRTAAQSPSAIPQSHLHGDPCFAWSLDDGAGFRGRPGAGSLEMGVGPSQDLLLGERGSLQPVAHTPMCGEQPG